MVFLANREKYRKLLSLALSFVLLVVVGVMEVLTIHELSFSLFYLIPVIMVGWWAGREWGMVFSVVTVVVWLIADVLSGSTQLHPAIYIWNTMIRLSFFVFMVLLLSKIVTLLEYERKIARTDYLTGALSSRFFYDVLQMEINRSQRYKSCFTLAYLDLDNFKTVNDLYGHATGDEVLCFVVQQIQNDMRKTDLIARLGGDEFALLLSETD